MSNNTKIPLNYIELPKLFSKELKTELAMRRIFTEIQPRELEKIVTRIYAKNQEAKN